MEHKIIISVTDVNYPGVKRGELELTDEFMLLYKKGFLFFPRSLVKRLPLSSIADVQLARNGALELAGTEEAERSFNWIMTFGSIYEAEKVMKYLDTFVQERKQKKEEEEKERAAWEAEKERKERLDSYRSYIGRTLKGAWELNRHLYRLCTATSQDNRALLKESSEALEQHIEVFFKAQGQDRDIRIPNFKELAERGDIERLEKGGVYLLEYVGRLLGKHNDGDLDGTLETEGLPRLPELKYFYVYTALVSEVALLMGLNEPDELYKTASKMELIAPIVEEKFGLKKARELASSLLHHTNLEEVAAIHQQMVAEVETYFQQRWGDINR
ncbi:MAG: hypothetical protein Q8P44_06840 [Dehalococcoidia bacterium]|nr:hypothetical protein [Dehalococcoidia bacterium]